MDMTEAIATRKSVRTFDGRPLSAEDRAKLEAFCATIENPFGVPVEFVFLDAAEHGLSSPVIRGEQLYIAAKAPYVEHREGAYGFAFETMVLYAWTLGIGTTWIGGTMDRATFEKAANVGEGELMMIVSPLGYPAAERSDVDAKLRAAVRGDERFAASELFFQGDFATPLAEEDPLLEAVRWAPSAANKQPWRVVKDGNRYHLFEKHGEGFTANPAWDVQKIDMGIALCHLMRVTGGSCTIDDPDIATEADTEYFATVVV